MTLILQRRPNTSSAFLRNSSSRSRSSLVDNSNVPATGTLCFSAGIAYECNRQAQPGTLYNINHPSASDSIFPTSIELHRALCKMYHLLRVCKLMCRRPWRRHQAAGAVRKRITDVCGTTDKVRHKAKRHLLCRTPSPSCGSTGCQCLERC